MEVRGSVIGKATRAEGPGGRPEVGVPCGRWTSWLGRRWQVMEREMARGPSWGSGRWDVEGGGGRGGRGGNRGGRGRYLVVEPKGVPRRCVGTGGRLGNAGGLVPGILNQAARIIGAKDGSQCCFGDGETGRQPGRRGESGSRESGVGEDVGRMREAKARPDSSEARGHALPGACSAVWHWQAGKHWEIASSRLRRACQVGGSRERGWIAGDWRMVAGTQGCRHWTVPRARGWDWTKRRAATGWFDSLGTYVPERVPFWEWLADSQDKKRVPWIALGSRSTTSTGLVESREPTSIECRGSRLRDDGVAGHGVAEWRPGSGQLPVWAAKRLP